MSRASGMSLGVFTTNRARNCQKRRREERVACWLLLPIATASRPLSALAASAMTGAAYFIECVGSYVESVYIFPTRARGHAGHAGTRDAGHAGERVRPARIREPASRTRYREMELSDPHSAGAPHPPQRDTTRDDARLVGIDIPSPFATLVQFWHTRCYGWTVAEGWDLHFTRVGRFRRPTLNSRGNSTQEGAPLSSTRTRGAAVSASRL